MASKNDNAEWRAYMTPEQSERLQEVEAKRDAIRVEYNNIYRPIKAYCDTKMKRAKDKLKEPVSWICRAGFDALVLPRPGIKKPGTMAGHRR